MNSPIQDSQTQGEMEQPATEPQGKPFRALIEAVNIAETLDEDKLLEIGREAKTGYEQDKESRKEWDDAAEDWIKLAKQVRENRTYPWPNASNVKYPLMTTAAMQFAARAYPSLVPSNGQIVKAKVIGKDPTGKKLELATRVSSYMSYQVMHEIPAWEEEMDKLLIQLPVIGMMFKKTYWDPVKKVPVSDLISPKNLIVNYWAKSLVEAERISEEIEMSPRVLKERQLSKTFLDIDLGTAPIPEKSTFMGNDQTVPYILIEQHTYVDLDDDGYREPYTVTFHKESGKVLRIAARYDEPGIHLDDDGGIVKIEPLLLHLQFLLFHLSFHLHFLKLRIRWGRWGLPRLKDLGIHYLFPIRLFLCL